MEQQFKIIVIIVCILLAFILTLILVLGFGSLIEEPKKKISIKEKQPTITYLGVIVKKKDNLYIISEDTNLIGKKFEVYYDENLVKKFGISRTSIEGKKVKFAIEEDYIGMNKKSIIVAWSVRIVEVLEQNREIYNF